MPCRPTTEGIRHPPWEGSGTFKPQTEAARVPTCPSSSGTRRAPEMAGNGDYHGRAGWWGPELRGGRRKQWVRGKETDYIIGRTLEELILSPGHKTTTVQNI